MIYLDHHTNTDLTPEEKHELREREQVKSQFVSEALAVLNPLMGPHVSPESVYHAVEVLKGEPHADIPPQYLTIAPHDSTGAAATPTSVPRQITEGNSTARSLSRNDEYEKSLALREKVDEFSVPLTPLPLSIEAQQDQRILTGEHRRDSLHAVSYIAPLFSHSSQEMSEEEKERLSFLAPPKNSPKEQTLRLLQERHRYDKQSDPTAKARFNEPKQLPNLHQKVAADFVPECAAKLTMSADMRYSGNPEHIRQIAAAKESNQGRSSWR